MILGLKKNERASASAPEPAAAAAATATATASGSGSGNLSPPRSSLGSKTNLMGLFKGVISGIHKSKRPKGHIKFEEGWDVLKQGIVTCSKHLEDPTTETRMSEEEITDCNNCASALAMQKKHFRQEMYEGYKKELKDCVCAMVLPHLMSKPNRDIVDALATQWKSYSIMVKSVSTFLIILEPSYTEPNNLPSLETAAANIFFSQIRQIRDGIEVDMDSLKDIVDGINGPEVKESLEYALTEDAEIYYSRKTSNWVAKLSPSEYLDMVKDIIKESIYLKLLHIEEDSSQRLLQAVRALLMKDYDNFALPVGLVIDNPPKELSYVGILNEGATCHLNCVLQVLFHIPYFRKAIREVNCMPTGGLILALQRLFHQLRYSKNPVSAKNVTKSLGWNPSNSLVHEDFEEQCKLLFEKIEQETKGTKTENLINKLFSGRGKHETIWIGPNTVSTSDDIFYVKHLEVRGYKGVYSSLDKLVQKDLDCNVRREINGEVVHLDAERKFLFKTLPPILFLNLRRADFDVRQEKSVKVNDRFEFPFILDLDRDDGKYLSADADKNFKNTYTLYRVIAHSGSTPDSGHYIAFVRPEFLENWIMLSDTVVTSITSTEKLEELFGGGPDILSPCASMLVYVRQDSVKELFIDAQRHPEEERLFKKEEAQASDGLVDIEAQLTDIPQELTYDQNAKGILGQGTSIGDFLRSMERAYKLQDPNFSVRAFLKSFLRCELLLQLAAVYSGFHAVLFFIDWVTESKLTQEVHKTVARGVFWFIVLIVYLLLLRHIRVKRHYAAEPAPKVVDMYLAARKIRKPKPPRSDNTGKKEEDLRIVSVARMKREDNSDIGLAMVLSSAKLLFDSIEDVAEDSMGKSKDKSGDYLNTWLHWRLIAHSSALAVEVIGSYIVRLVFRTGGPPPIIDTSAW